MKQTLKAFLTHGLTSFYGVKSSKLQNPYRGAAQDRLVGMQAAKEPENQLQPQTPFFPGPTVGSTGQETQPTRQSNVWYRKSAYSLSWGFLSVFCYSIYLNQLLSHLHHKNPFLKGVG